MTINEYKQELLSNGFRVINSIINDKPAPNYFHFEKGNKIGYCQYDKFRGFSFSTVHKPNKQTGTGFGIEKDIANPTIDNALNSFLNFPSWASLTDRNSVIKYNGLDDFLNSLWCEYEVLTDPAQQG